MLLAIKLSNRNHQTILTKVKIDPRDLDAMIQEYSDHPNAPLYMAVPGTTSEPTPEWTTIPVKYLQKNYDYDASKIDTQFVETHHK